MTRRGVLVAAAAAALSGCGYHVGGHADLLPKTIRTIAIPAFSNATTRYRLSQRLPGAITREFLSRTRYKVVDDPAGADAVLTGSVIFYGAYAVVFDPVRSRASVVQVNVNLQIVLKDRTTGAVLFERPNMEFRERYEISADAAQYFDESDTALDRLSRDVARGVVSAVLEKF